MIAALGFLISPIGLISAAVVTLGVLVYQNFDAILGFVVDVTNSFIDFYNNVAKIPAIIAGIKFVAKSVFDFLYHSVKGVIDIFKSFGTIIKLIFQRRFDEIPDVIEKAFEKAGDNAENLGKDVADNFADGVKDEFESRLTKVTTEGLKNSLNNAVENVKDSVAGMANVEQIP